MAMHPDKFAQFFYDQGVSSAVDNVAKSLKTLIWMLDKQTHRTTKTD